MKGQTLLQHKGREWLAKGSRVGKRPVLGWGGAGRDQRPPAAVGFGGWVVAVRELQLEKPQAGRAVMSRQWRSHQQRRGGGGEEPTTAAG